MPTASAGIANVPCSPLTVVNTAPVASCFAVTVAPGMAPPCESNTVPEIDDVAPPWAAADVARPAARTDASIAETRARFILSTSSLIEAMTACTSAGAFVTPDLDGGQLYAESASGVKNRTGGG